MTPIEDMDKLRDIADNICDEYTVPRATIEWSTRLKRTAGKAWATRNLIHLALNLYVEFGYERTRKTLLHELAHHIAWHVNGIKGHGLPFKNLCQKLGGSMNTRMAGTAHADCASTEYCSTTYHMIFHCPCGQDYKYKRGPKARALNYSYCRKCKTFLKDMRVERL